MVNLLGIEINNISCGTNALNMTDGVYTRCACDVAPISKRLMLQQENISEKECQEISQFIINENIQCFFYSAKYLNNSIVANSEHKALMQKQDKR